MTILIQSMVSLRTHLARILLNFLDKLGEYRYQLLRLGIILGAIAGAAGLGLVAGKKSPTFALIAACLPLVWIGAEILVQHQEFMPVIILTISSITAFYVSKGITPGLVLTAAFTGVWLLGQMLNQHRIRFIKTPVMKACIIWMVVAIISLFWGQVMADPALVVYPDNTLIQMAQLAVLILSPAALILTANLITQEKHLQWLVLIYLAVTSYGIIAEVFHLPKVNLRGLNSSWAVGLIYGQLLYNKFPRWVKVGLIGLIGLWFVKFFFGGITWLSGWLPMVVTIGVITFFRSRKVFIVGVLVVGVIVAVTLPSWLKDYNAEYSESGGNRLAKWEFLYKQPFVWEHAFLGTGPFGYARYFMTYFPNNAASTHSNYIDIFLQMGFVGSFAFIGIVLTLFQEWWKLYKMKISSPFLQGYIHTAIGGFVAILIAMFLGDWFTPFVLNQGLHGFSWTVLNWIFLGGMVAIPTLCVKKVGQT